MANEIMKNANHFRMMMRERVKKMAAFIRKAIN